jgi:hypothetical protein
MRFWYANGGYLNGEGMTAHLDTFNSQKEEDKREISVHFLFAHMTATIEEWEEIISLVQSEIVKAQEEAEAA